MKMPVKASVSGGWKSSYRLETRNLSCKLSSKFDELNWVCFGRTQHRVPNKFILKDVNCEARPGEITAIAGPSGAGKTTLLEILAGKVFLVKGLIKFCALLRLPGGQKEAANRVKKLMKELGLEHVAASRIGEGSNWGISGLDSASALHVVILLKSMAVNQGKTIILTIHQPGFRILELFDRVILLSNGLIMHNGSLHFLEERLKFAGHHIPRHVNVLEFAIDVIESLEDQNSVPISLQSNHEETCIMGIPQEKLPSCCYPNSVLEEVLILGQRFCSNIFRTKQLFVTRTIQALVAGLILGTIFLNAGNETGQVALQTRTGFFAFSLTFLLSSTTEGLPIFLQERRILMRETSRGAYRISSYVLSNTLIFIPFLLLVVLLYSTPVYWLVGLRRDVDGFLYFCLVAWMVLLMSNSFVACFSALVPNFIMGTSVIAGLMGSFFLFSGYFISKNNIPSYWIFMHYLSLFKYPFECFLINEYGGEKGSRSCIEVDKGICNLDGSGFLRQQDIID
ncbi:hypothetical protein GH714_039660 [Hevea brasiliensis]|uniref:AAA+ ATPase domain-containing protein n=1 Tax=Hevea brasiliensis TaxID=3981 RepID=A0A6A6KFX8_HEVBR|nr:hypothetical protein GH714_039660 [Hevea brasiliensis]